MFDLVPRNDLGALRARYAASGRVHVPGVFVESQARTLAEHLAARRDWRLIFNRGDELFEFDEAARTRISPAQLAGLHTAIENAGRRSFQYHYENIRVSEQAAERAAQGDALNRLADFLNSAVFLDFARCVLGCDEIAIADCQATCYRRGHFLNTHDDDVAGKYRVAAYVLNLTPCWRAEWGGQLQFLGDDGHVAEAFVPQFNALNLLRVPQPHLVGMVTTLAPPDARRVSITGWLRRGLPA
jgi:SM-20-related protein